MPRQRCTTTRGEGGPPQRAKRQRQLMVLTMKLLQALDWESTAATRLVSTDPFEAQWLSGRTL